MTIPDSSVAAPAQCFTPRQSQQELLTPRQSQQELLRRLQEIQASLSQQSQDICGISWQLRKAVREELQGFLKEIEEAADGVSSERAAALVRQPEHVQQQWRSSRGRRPDTMTSIYHENGLNFLNARGLESKDWSCDELTTTSFAMRPFETSEVRKIRESKRLSLRSDPTSDQGHDAGARSSSASSAVSPSKQAFATMVPADQLQDGSDTGTSAQSSAAPALLIKHISSPVRADHASNGVSHLKKSRSEESSSTMVCEEVTDLFPDELGRVHDAVSSADDPMPESMRRQSPPPPADELPGVPAQSEPNTLEMSKPTAFQDMTPVLPFGQDDDGIRSKNSKGKPATLKSEDLRKAGTRGSFESQAIATKDTSYVAFKAQKQKSMVSVKSIAAADVQHYASMAFGKDGVMAKMLQRGKKNPSIWSHSPRHGPAWKQRGCWSALVQSAAFDSFTCALLVLNAISIGFECDYMARHILEDRGPVYFEIFEYIFTVLFTIELGIRIYVYRCEFFSVKGWAWNVFDTCIVSVQLVDMVFTIIDLPGGGVMKIVKLLRLVRILRLFRLMRLITELQKMIYLICGSLWSFLWTLVLLLGMVYSLGVVMTQLVSDHRRENRDQLQDSGNQGLADFYGSLPLSVLSLYQAISGGEDWANVLAPLVTEISPIMAVLFSCYIAFASLVMLNLVTGVFVDSAQRIIKEDREAEQHSIARSIFKSTDESADGMIEWTEFQQHLDNPKMEEFFKAIDISMCEARGLFHLLDRDGAGAITLEEFVLGCARLRGSARSVDLAVLSRDHATYVKRWVTHAADVELQLRNISEWVTDIGKQHADTRKINR